MPVHDWTRVDAGIFNAFHHSWIEEIARALNRGLLHGDYYALPGQFAAGFGPDVLTVQGDRDGDDGAGGGAPAPRGGVTLLAPPKLRPMAETDTVFYRRKQKVITVRDVSDDRVVAVVELVSPDNKAARNPLRAFVQKAAELLEKGVHLLIIDLSPPGKRDPNGIHAEIWEEITGQGYEAPADRPLTLAAYDAGNALRAYVVNTAVGEAMADMPLFLEPGQAVTVPAEATYNVAFAEVPRRWRRVLEAPTE
jgi:hypothetical protein